MNHQVVILQECASQAFTSIAVKVGDLNNELFLADVNKLFVQYKLYFYVIFYIFILIVEY